MSRSPTEAPEEDAAALGARDLLMRLGLTVVIGAIGGAIAAHFQLPLAWMIGALCATTVASLSGLPLYMPKELRGVMVAVLGVMLGSAFSPEMVGQIARWLPTIGALFLYSGIVTAVLYAYFRHVAGFDAPTAYFSATPGGLNEMVIVGGEMGGDERRISLIHGGRVLFVVLTVPFGFSLLGAYSAGDGPPIGVSLLDIPPADLAVLVACGLAGIVLARRLRVPAANVTGPMIVSAAAHLSGVTDSKPPAELVAMAQVFVGAAVGARFAGLKVRHVLKTLAYGLGATVIMLVFTIAFSLALAPLELASFPGLVLAYAPGGLAEMSLIALALGIEAAFVSSHHIVRIVIVVIIAPLVYRRLIGRPAEAGPPPDRG